jgi:predicted transcriptional regulator
LAQKGQETPVVEVMKREFLPIHPGEMFDVVFQRLQECQCHTIPVVQRERLVGLVTMDNLGEFLLIQSALSAKNPSSGGEIKWAYQSRT